MWLLKNPACSRRSSEISLGCISLRCPPPCVLLVLLRCATVAASCRKTYKSPFRADVIFSSFISTLLLLPSRTQLQPCSELRSPVPSLQMESASDTLPSPFCLPCFPIGLHGASLYAVQITAVTLANHTHKHTHARTHAGAGSSRLSDIHAQSVRGNLFFTSLFK